MTDEEKGLCMGNYIQKARIIAALHVVGVGVNRIGKVYPIILKKL